MRRLGPAEVKHDQKTERWVWRRCNVPTRHLDRHAAERMLSKLIEETGRQVIAPTDRAATVADLAAEFLDFAEHTRRVKPSVLAEWRRLLGQSRDRVRGGGQTNARIRRTLGNVPAGKVTSKMIATFSRDLDRQGLSARNVNVHRRGGAGNRPGCP